MMTILDAARDANLFARWFSRGDWTAWEAYLCALFGLPMSGEQMAVYRKHTGRTELPQAPFSEAWLVIGRRGGKSFIMALVAVYLATFRRYVDYLQPGERATVMVIAADRKQARVIMRYVRGLLTEIPMLTNLVESETTESFQLEGQVTIEVGTASSRTTRGYTFAAVLCDEIAFWPSEDAAEPDYAVLDAIRPGMASIPGSVLMCGSSPHARRGALWDAHRRYYGQDGAPVLVWQAATRDMNPTIPQAVVTEAYARDASSASAEYGGQFRADIESLLSREAVAAVIDEGVRERPYDRRYRYFGFVDPSGGSSDAMTLAIAHREGDVVIVDVIRERKPPFSPEAVVSEFCQTLKAYGLRKVHGDRYGGEWPREQFRKLQVDYELATKTRSELYQALVPTINSRKVQMLDLPMLEAQLVALERRTTRGGRESIDHPPGGHDDVANAAAGAIHLAMPAASGYDLQAALYGADGKDTGKNWNRPFLPIPGGFGVGY